jgi:hypothetical protein
LQPYGDTGADPGPLYPDQPDDRAARRTLRFLAVALFVAVVAGAVVLSLVLMDDDESSPVAGGEVETVTTLPPPPELGPDPGVELAGYVAGRKAALAATRDERVAVVSLAKYSTQTQAKTLAGSLPIVALLVAPPGIGPSVVTGDLATWTKSETEAIRAELEEIKALIPTVDDPAFKAFYTQEVERFDKALKSFAPDSALVFGVVVRGPAAALQALDARSEVRLVDVGETAVPDPKAIYRGLRPEEQVKANEPALRPL